LYPNNVCRKYSGTNTSRSLTPNRCHVYFMQISRKCIMWWDWLCIKKCTYWESIYEKYAAIFTYSRHWPLSSREWPTLTEWVKPLPSEQCSEVQNHCTTQNYYLK
jgi:hypothetical protein